MPNHRRNYPETKKQNVRYKLTVDNHEEVALGVGLTSDLADSGWASGSTLAVWL